jgi:hypothetical protein
MKFLVSIFLTALLAFACGIYLPWWSVAIAAFIVGLSIGQSPFTSFIAGFVGIFLLWSVVSVAIDSANHNILAPRISTVIGVGGSVFLLVLVTCIAGSIAGGLGALTGSLLRRAIS